MISRICLIICLIILAISSCRGFIIPPRSVALSRYPTRRVAPCPTASLHTRAASSNSDEDWKVGDVYRDLDVLEKAIHYDNAEQNLKQAERIEIMEYSAQQRRPLFPDFRKFVLAPLTFSLMFRLLDKNATIKFITLMITTSMDFHFWMVVVCAPLILLLSKALYKPEPEAMPEELQALDPQYLPLVATDWKDPKTSSEDHVLFLLEHWAATVMGIGIFGVLHRLKLLSTHNIVTSWMSLAQLLTRVGVIVSLQQYQRPLFRLLRHQQPRPVGFFPSMLQLLVRCMLAAAPWGLTFDLLRCLTHLKRGSIVALYTSVIAVLFGTWVRMQQKDRDEFQKLEQNSAGTKLIQVAATIAFWKKPIETSCQRLRGLPFQRYISRPRTVLLATSATSIVGLLPIVGPIAYMATFASQIRIVYTHDLSLSMGVKEFKESIENEHSMKQSMKWRYRIEWRDDRRLKPLLKQWTSGLGHWWLVKGSVTEKLSQEKIEHLRKAGMKGKTVWERMKADGLQNSNRDQWKNEAMERLATKHQEDYDNKHFEDHLGVAVYRVFGIGLGYKFDHMRTLGNNEKPSTRRLQARAAKSAIKKAQDFYDASSAAKAELDGIADPTERNRRARELREQVEVEMKYMAQRLAELIPTGPSPEFKSSRDIQQLKQTNFKRTGSNEYVAETPIANDFDGENFLRDYMKETSGEAHSDTIDDGAPQRGESDEFVEAYLEHLENGKDDDDGDEGTVLA